MGSYRKRPVVVEAEQWFTFRDVADAHIQPLGPEEPEKGYINTLEGGHEVTPGDWIITGVQGERYPCKPDIFTATYEAVSEGETNG